MCYSCREEGDMIQTKAIEGGSAHLTITPSNGASVMVLIRGEPPQSTWFAEGEEAEEFFNSLPEPVES